VSAPAVTPRQASEVARFATEGFTTTTLFENERVRVLVAALEPGQEIPLHAPQVTLVLTVTERVGELLAEWRAHPLRAGAVAAVPAGKTRGIRARSTRLVLLNVVTLPPGASDHVRAAAARWPEQRRPGKIDPAALTRAQHAELRPHLAHLRGLADELEVGDEQQLRRRLERVTTFLRDGVLSHAAIEEATVYPAADRLLRALGGATGTMSLEHRLIAARVAELERLAAAHSYDMATRGELRRSLTGLEAVLRGHFDKEEQVYVPLLEHLTADESDELQRSAQGGTSTDRDVDHRPIHPYAPAAARAAPTGAVQARPHRLGAAAPRAEPDRQLGRAHVPPGAGV
jgi:quercetin dioxygenase-like cupin family protein/hemerythrin-like domain-containing protein